VCGWRVRTLCGICVVQSCSDGGCFVLQPTYDPTTSYYTSAFRGGDADRLYPPYVPTNTSSKYSGNIGLMTAPSLPSSQEVRVGYWA